MRKRLLASRLRHLIQILVNKQTSETEPENWQVKCENFAEIQPLAEMQLKEFDSINFGHLLSEEYFIFTIRFISDFPKKFRIKFGNRSFEVKKIINPLETNKLFKIIALEITEG